jgi:hypothetical protein
VAEGRVPDAGAEAVLLDVERRHLTGEVLNLLAECSPVVGCSDAGERRLGCDLGDAVCAERCGFQAALRLTGEVGLYIGG